MPLLLAALLVAWSLGQAAPPARNEASVRGLPTFAAAAKGSGQNEITLRWVVAASQAASPAGGQAAAATSALVVPGSVPELNQFEILKRRAVNETPVRERNPQLATDELVMVAVDAQGREIAWQRIKDPRIVRSEQPGPSGQLTGQVFYKRETELVIRLPDAVVADHVLVYGVEWNGREFLLRGLAAIPIPR
jgi:hypothetical protein